MAKCFEVVEENFVYLGVYERVYIKTFDFLATRVVILLVQACVTKCTIHIKLIRELKSKKPKHENLIFFLNLDITLTSPYI